MCELFQFKKRKKKDKEEFSRTDGARHSTKNIPGRGAEALEVAKARGRLGAHR